MDDTYEDIDPRLAVTIAEFAGANARLLETRAVCKRLYDLMRDHARVEVDDVQMTPEWMQQLRFCLNRIQNDFLHDLKTKRDRMVLALNQPPTPDV